MYSLTRNLRNCKLGVRRITLYAAAMIDNAYRLRFYFHIYIRLHPKFSYESYI